MDQRAASGDRHCPWGSLLPPLPSCELPANLAMNNSDGMFERLSIHQFVRMDLSLEQFLTACARAGVRQVGLHRTSVEAAGLKTAVKLLRQSGMCASSYTGIGISAERRIRGKGKRLQDHLEALDAALELGTDRIVVAVGPLRLSDGNLEDGHRRVGQRLAELSPHAASRHLKLALEPLHPMYCPDRSILNSLRQSLELVSSLPHDSVGLTVDTYHVWWDPYLDEVIRAGCRRIQVVHINDFVVPVTREHHRRGLMGEGCIDLYGFRQMIEDCGFAGPYEVEVQNELLSSLDIDEVVRRIVGAYAAFWYRPKVDPTTQMRSG